MSKGSLRSLSAANLLKTFQKKRNVNLPNNPG